MKTLLSLVLILALSSCATGPRRAKANLAIDDEPTAPTRATSETAPPAPTDEPAPQGEIVLGIEGGATGPVVVEPGVTLEEPVDEETEATEAEKKKEEEAAKKETEKKKKSSGWATGNDEADFEPDPEE